MDGDDRGVEDKIRSFERQCVGFSLEYEQDHHPRPPPYGKLVNWSKWLELATAFYVYGNQLFTLDQLTSPTGG